MQEGCLLLQRVPEEGLEGPQEELRTCRCTQQHDKPKCSYLPEPVAVYAGAVELSYPIFGTEGAWGVEEHLLWRKHRLLLEGQLRLWRMLLVRQGDRRGPTETVEAD
jgi:hypothetical protein